MIAGANVITVGFSLTGLFVWRLLAGCQMLGPTALSTGRSTYNDVIARSGADAWADRATALRGSYRSAHGLQRHRRTEVQRRGQERGRVRATGELRGPIGPVLCGH